MAGQRLKGLRFWASVVIISALASLILVRLGAPSPFLFAGVLGGGAVAIGLRAERPLPKPLQYAGLALIGVASGAQIDADVVKAVAARPGIILGSVAATLIVTLACGQILRFSKNVSSATATFASIAGAASGVTAVVREVGGDDAVVMTIQYVRVLAVLATVPVAVGLLGATPAQRRAPAEAVATVQGFLFTVLCVILGLIAAHFLSFSASRLVLPLLVAMGVSLAGLFSSTAMPPQLLDLGYCLIGLMVGLSMTMATLRILLRIMPLVFVQLGLGLAGCAAVGVAIAQVTGVSTLDAYLMTTPGGLPAVSAIALGSGASVGLVVTVQLVRVFSAIVMATLMGAVFSRRGAAKVSAEVSAEVSDPLPSASRQA
jgi:membrane AbrB-like protein